MNQDYRYLSIYIEGIRTIDLSMGMCEMYCSVQVSVSKPCCVLYTHVFLGMVRTRNKRNETANVPIQNHLNLCFSLLHFYLLVSSPLFLCLLHILSHRRGPAVDFLKISGPQPWKRSGAPSSYLGQRRSFLTSAVQFLPSLLPTPFSETLRPGSTRCSSLHRARRPPGGVPLVSLSSRNRGGWRSQIRRIWVSWRLIWASRWSEAATTRPPTFTAAPCVLRLTICSLQNFPFVLAADRSVVLLSAILVGPRTDVDIDTDTRYFVLNAITGTTLDLPEPQPEEPMKHQELIGVLACSASLSSAWLVLAEAWIRGCASCSRNQCDSLTMSRSFAGTGAPLWWGLASLGLP